MGSHLAAWRAALASGDPASAASASTSYVHVSHIPELPFLQQCWVIRAVPESGGFSQAFSCSRSLPSSPSLLPAGAVGSRILFSSPETALVVSATDGAPRMK